MNWRVIQSLSNSKIKQMNGIQVTKNVQNSLRWLLVCSQKPQLFLPSCAVPGIFSPFQNVNI